MDTSFLSFSGPEISRPKLSVLLKKALPHIFSRTFKIFWISYLYEFLLKYSSEEILIELNPKSEIYNFFC